MAATATAAAALKQRRAGPRALCSPTARGAATPAATAKTEMRLLRLVVMLSGFVVSSFVLLFLDPNVNIFFWTGLKVAQVVQVHYLLRRSVR